MSTDQFESQIQYSIQLSILNKLVKAKLLTQDEFIKMEAMVRQRHNAPIISSISLYQLDLS